VSLYVPVARLEAALGLMGDLALRPDFPEKELERLKKRALTGLLQARSEPRQLAQVALARSLFGEHRYGLPAAGDALSIPRLGVADLRAFYTRSYRPDNAVLVVAGDVTRDVLGPLDRVFGSWTGGAMPPAEVSVPAQVKGRRLVLIDKADAAQSVIRVGRVGPSRKDPDYAALEVMNTLLGASFTSRLNDNLREQHGWAYGADSSFAYRRVSGYFQAAADVQTPSTAEALREMLRELDRIRTPATAQEVERARNYLALGYAEEFETTRQIAAKIAEQVVYGLPEDVFTGFVPRALAVGVPEVAAAARKTVDPQNAVVVVVGDRKAIEGPLRALGLGPVEVLSVDAVMGPQPRVD
jgi:zinc protease